MLDVMNEISEEKREELIADMSTYQKKVYAEYMTNAQKEDTLTIAKLIREFDSEFVQKLLDLEIEIQLKKDKEGNRRNGRMKERKICIDGQWVSFNRPRLRREKEFNSVFLPKRRRILDNIRDNVILLYSKNNSVNDIKEILKGMFKLDLSTSKISELVQEISGEVVKWRNKPLQKYYPFVNIDCTYITVRDEMHMGSHKIPVYIVIGTDMSGHKEIVGMYLGNEDEEKNIIDDLSNKDVGESKARWIEVFEDMKDRGLEKISFLCSDGLAGIKEATEDSFPGCRYQWCIVHIVRNVYKALNKTESPKIIQDFKKIYSATSYEESQMFLEEFNEKYENKKALINRVKRYYEYIKPLFNYPEGIRKYVYTNNIVESANSVIQRGFKGRGALPSNEAAINILYFNLRDLEETWKKHAAINWPQISNELILTLGKEIEEYI